MHLPKSLTIGYCIFETITNMKIKIDFQIENFNSYHRI